MTHWCAWGHIVCIGTFSCHARSIFCVGVRKARHSAANASHGSPADHSQAVTAFQPPNTGPGSSRRAAVDLASHGGGCCVVPAPMRTPQEVAIPVAAAVPLATRMPMRVEQSDAGDALGAGALAAVVAAGRPLHDKAASQHRVVIDEYHYNLAHLQPHVRSEIMPVGAQVLLPCKC